VTIHKVNHRFELHCDMCGYEVEEYFDTLQEVLDFQKEAGWRVEKRKEDEWLNICDDCWCGGHLVE